MFSVNKDATPEPLEIRKSEDKAKKRVYFEMLFQYSGVSLSQDIFQPDAREVLLTAQRTAQIFMEMHKANIFHSDIKPANIVRDGDTFKVIDFGVSLTFDEDEKFIKAVESTTEGFRGWTEAFVPPEKLRRAGKYERYKFDVYCWGMTIYQYATRKNGIVLENEANAYKMESTKYIYFLNLLDDINLCNDNEDKIKNFLIPVLKLALAESPENRPTFADINKMLDNGKDLLLPRKPGNSNDENMRLKEELKKEQNRNISLNDSLLHEQEERKKLEEICRKNEYEIQQFTTNLKTKEQEFIETLNILKIKFKECIALKKENEELELKLSNSENKVKELIKNIPKDNMDSGAAMVNNYLNEDQKKSLSTKNIVSEEQKKSPLIKGSNLKELNILSVVNANGKTFFQCNCTCKMNIKLKCSHMLCFSCVENVMKNITKNNCKWENVKCGKCNSSFKIGKFSDIKSIDLAILKCGCICKWQKKENVTRNRFDFTLKSKS